MACSRGKATPNSFTKSKLFANSGGFCQRPDCNENLFKTFTNTEIHIAEIAHIISANNGARSNKDFTAEEKGDYENLILLCSNCHTTIDKAEKDFPEELIIKWKNEHERRLKNLFGIKKFDSRELVREVVNPIFLENKVIFDTYGPETNERYNPESQMPIIWLKKIRESIIPNNRKLYNLINTNYHLTNSAEKIAFTKFTQHINDFEAKHIFNFENNGTLFPKEITEIYV
jgi:hypothetical protein